MIQAFKTVRYLSKHHITKEKISLTFLVMTIFFTKLIYIKDSAWLKLFRHSNSLYVRATRAITNHALIGEYCLRFFSRELFKYPCSLYLIKSRCHILQEYRRYNNYWNPNKKSLKHFVAFWSLIQEPSCCGNH